MSIEHNLITAVNNHGIISGLGPYSSAATRQAQVVTSADVGKVALQVVTGVTTAWLLLSQTGGVGTWLQINTTADTGGGGGGGGGPSGTDFGALAVSNGLTVVGYFRGDYGVSGSSGSGAAVWANIAGGMSSITPDASATNGLGTATAGLNSRAGLKLNGATQMGAMTAPALAAPGTTNWHRYYIARQASGGSGAVRKILSETGDAYKVELASASVTYAYGATSNGNNTTLDTWLRTRVSYTGSTTSEIKIGNQTAGTGGTGAVNTAPATARTFGSLLLNFEWLMYMEVTGTKANFLTFAAAADTAAQTTWTSAIEI